MRDTSIFRRGGGGCGDILSEGLSRWGGISNRNNARGMKERTHIFESNCKLKSCVSVLFVITLVYDRLEKQISWNNSTYV